MSKPKRKNRGISWSVSIALLILIAAVLCWVGYDYYLLSLDDRVEHPDFRTLRSSGDVGMGYGVAGTLLIFTNLLYLLRRRFAKWNLGSVKTWLDLHVFTGLAGALFISFHSTFKARNTIAQVTSWSLLLVVVTGLVGRFLYALVPRRDDQGLANALDELQALAPDACAAISMGLKDSTPSPPGKISLLQLVPYLRALGRVRSQQRELIRLSIQNSQTPLPESQQAEFIERLQYSSRRALRSMAAGAILRSWRAMHLFFAILMLLSVVFHIGIAWYYGYRWIWSD